MIGGSIARRARARGDRVVGFDLDPQTTAYACEHAIVDEATATFEELAGTGDVLVVAAPLGATIEILERCASAPDGRTKLVIDVASVKAPLVRFVGRVADFVPTHPLAGAEQSGPAASRADLFVNRPWAYVPTADDRLDARAAAFIRAMGAHPVPLDAALHDRVVALTSHVPQLLSTLLAAVLADENDPRIADLHGPGLESMLRLARSEWSTWAPIVAANSGSIATGLRALASSAVAAADAVDAGDGGALAALFQRANAFAAKLDIVENDGR